MEETTYTFDDLCNGYNDRDSQPFEVWLADALGVEIPYVEENGEKFVDLGKLFDTLKKETGGKRYTMTPHNPNARRYPTCNNSSVFASDYKLQEVLE